MLAVIEEGDMKIVKCKDSSAVSLLENRRCVGSVVHKKNDRNSCQRGLKRETFKLWLLSPPHSRVGVNVRFREILN